jgi:aminopeptidase
MTDERLPHSLPPITQSPSPIEAYARLLVERGVGIQAGWQVLVRTNPLARPLVEAVMRQIAQRGAYALLRMSYGAPHMNLMAVDVSWVTAAPEHLLATMPPIEQHALDHADAIILIEAPDGREAEAADELIARRHLLRQSVRRFMERLGSGLPTTYGMFPTAALADAAGMTLDAYADFVFDACLVDWDAQADRLARIAQQFDGAATIHISGDDTDLRFSLAGASAGVEDGRDMLPGGRLFWQPVQGSLEGTLRCREFPAFYRAAQFDDLRLTFSHGAVVHASAGSGEAELHALLGEGAPWTVREFGIGCNPRIARYTHHDTFDTRIDGTMHLVLAGGSVRHAPWTVVKDLRQGGRIMRDEQEMFGHATRSFG